MARIKRTGEQKEVPPSSRFCLPSATLYASRSGVPIGPAGCHAPRFYARAFSSERGSPRALRSERVPSRSFTLDYAQRTNTIGSLNADDVSQSITAPQVIAKASSDGQIQQSMAATAVSLREYASVMRDLNNRLHEPFVTVNTVTGDVGIKKAQDEYEQLIRNKTPKSQR